MEEKEILYENLYWDALDVKDIGEDYKALLSFFKEEKQRDEMLREIRAIFKDFYPHLDEDEIEWYVSPGIVKQCPVCLHWEDDDEDFVFDEERNVYVCNRWDYCRVD